MANEAEATRVDIAIIGAGPAGLAAGAQAARRKISHVVLDSARLAYTIFRYQKGKHVMDEPSELPLRGETGFGAFKASSRETVLQVFEQASREAGTNICAGPGNAVTRISGATGNFVLSLADGRTVLCATLVLATGAGDVRTFQVPGANLPHVAYQLDDPEAYSKQTISVVGAGDAGIENALALAKSDNDVSIVNRGADFARAKPQNATDITVAIKGGTITHYANCEVERFEAGAMVLSGGVRQELDLVIGRLGAIPSRDLLKMIGVQFPSDPNGIPELSATYETNVPGVFLIGALAGCPLIKQCLNQGYEVIENICGNQLKSADEPLLQQRFAAFADRRSVDEHLQEIKSKVPLLGPLTTLQLRQFVGGSSIVRPRSGERIFSRHDYSDDFYMILSGTVSFQDMDQSGAADAQDHGGPRARLGTAGVGEFFGEIGLLSGRRRTATVTAGESCVLLKTPRKLMSTMTKDVPGIKPLIDRAFILHRIRDFAGPEVAPAEVGALADAAVLERFAQGHEIFHQGDESNGLLLIRSGSVTVSIATQEGEVIVGYLPAGNLLGEMTLCSPDTKRQATVRASVTTEIIRLPIAPLREFLARHPAVKTSLESL